MTVAIKTKLVRGGALPTRAYAGDAGADLRVTEGAHIRPGTSVKLGTGVCLELPAGFFGDVRARSSTTERGLLCVAVIDEDFRGEIKLRIWNISDQWQSVERGERVAQLIIVPKLAATFVEVDELSETLRGPNGFGSSGR